jgi:hypothetical protein
MRDALAKLHEELVRASRVDPESRELLRKLASDIERLVDRPGSQRPAESHRPRLGELAAKFEAEHPALAETVREIIDALAKAGL